MRYDNLTCSKVDIETKTHKKIEELLQKVKLCVIKERTVENSDKR